MSVWDAGEHQLTLLISELTDLPWNPWLQKDREWFSQPELLAQPVPESKLLLGKHGAPEAMGGAPGSSRLRCRRKQQLNVAKGVGGFPHPHPPGSAGAGAAGHGPPELPNLAKTNVSSSRTRNFGSRFTCLLQKGPSSSLAAKSS